MAWLGGCGKPPSGQAQLVLNASYAVPLPDSLALSGANIAPSGRVVAWAANVSSLILAEPSGAWRYLALPDSEPPLAAAFVEGDSVLEVIYGASATITRIDTTGRELARRTYAGGARIAAADRSAEVGWIGLLILDGAAQLSALTGDVVTRVPRADTPDDDALPANADETFLTVAENLVLLAAAHQPYTTSAIDVLTGGLVWRTHQPAVGREPPGAESERAIWAGLRTIALDEGYIRTFADLTSNQRLFVVYDQQGRVVRQRPIDVPLAFVDAVVSTQLLLGVRLGDRHELRVYRWHWSRSE